MLIDLTVPIRSAMTVFPGDPQVQIIPWSTVETHGSLTEALFMGTHGGTHMDAPAHVLEGAMTIDRIPLEALMGQAVVLDLTGQRGSISGSALERALEDSAFDDGMAVLLHTGLDTEEERFSRPRPLSLEAAQALAQRRARLVGVDGATVDPLEGHSLGAHTILLEAGIPVVENLANLDRLRYVTAGRAFRLTVLPLRLHGASGAPVRAVAEVKAP